MKRTNTPSKVSELFFQLLRKALKRELLLEKSIKSAKDMHPTPSSLLESISKKEEDGQRKQKQQEQQGMQRGMHKTTLARKLSRVLVRVLKDLVSEEEAVGYEQLAKLYLALEAFTFAKESIKGFYEEYTTSRDAALKLLDTIIETYKGNRQEMEVEENYQNLKNTIAKLINDLGSKLTQIERLLLYLLKEYGQTYEEVLPTLEEMEQNPQFQDYLEAGASLNGWLTVIQSADKDKLYHLICGPEGEEKSPLKDALVEVDKIVTPIIESYLEKVEAGINLVERKIIAAREKLNITDPQEEIEEIESHLPSWGLSSEDIKRLQERPSLKFQERQKTQTLK